MFRNKRLVDNPNPWAVAFVVAFAAFMETLDIAIANVSLLHIAGSLSASQDEATWVLTSYTVTNGIIIPMSGWFSKYFGRKKFFIFSVIGFTVTSLLCGTAPTLASLIFFRTLQGIMGGGLQPCSQAILADTFSVEKRGLAFAMYGMAVVFAPAIGPALGGWITDHFSWRWIFLVNLPVGLILLPLIQVLIKDPEYLHEEKRKRRESTFRIDYCGFSLLTVGLASLQIMLDRGQQDDWWNSSFIIILFIIAFISLLSFIIWEWFDSDPILDIRLLMNRNFSSAFILMFFMGFVLMGSTASLPLFVQNLLGYTSLDAGLVLTPGGLCLIVAMIVVGQLINRVDPRYLIIFGFTVSGFGLSMMANFNLDSSYNSIVIARITQTVGMSFLFIPINTVGYSEISANKSSNASAIINLARNIGGSVGISFATTLIARSHSFYHDYYAKNLNLLSQNYLDMYHGLNFSINAKISGSEILSHAIIYFKEFLPQTTMLSYLVIFKIYSVIFFSLIPLAFLFKKARIKKNEITLEI